jgi:hypothetical protein
VTAFWFPVTTCAQRAAAASLRSAFLDKRYKQIF